MSLSKISCAVLYPKMVLYFSPLTNTLPDSISKLISSQRSSNCSVVVAHTVNTFFWFAYSTVTFSCRYGVTHRNSFIPSNVLTSSSVNPPCKLVILDPEDVTYTLFVPICSNSFFIPVSRPLPIEIKDKIVVIAMTMPKTVSPFRNLRFQTFVHAMTIKSSYNASVVSSFLILFLGWFALSYAASRDTIQALQLQEVSILL